MQLDPLNVVARSHDIVLWSRVRGYQPAYLDHLLYHARQFFDYGGGLRIYPMTELPFWRLPMHRREQEARWADFAATHQTLLDDVRAQVHLRGPLSNHDFAGGERIKHYRGGKETALALYYLWLTGEVMIHDRQGFERVYDVRAHIAPPAWDYAAPLEEAEQFFARKTVAFQGLSCERGRTQGFSGYIQRRLDRAEAQQWLQKMRQQGELAGVEVEGSRERWFVLSTDVPVLSALEAGGIPEM